ncbi:MAG: NrfD/PsrC family molybdoenzyme membrane anchor subunit [Thermodesulfobacteriota bacterium]
MEGTIHIIWNWIVAIDLFAAGLSAGAFIISATAYFLGRERYETMTRIGAYIAPFPVIVGIIALIYDLERPHLFWKLFLTFQPNSVMSLGAWLLLFFSLFSMAHFYLWLPERFDYFKILPAIQNNKFLSRFKGDNLTKMRGLVAGFGIPISIGVGIYTGVLLGALTARPFWNNPMLPMLFLISAMMTGSAAICFVGCFVKGFRGMSRDHINTNKFMIHSIDFTLMVFSIIAVFLFILGLYVSPRSSVAAVHLIMGGEFTLLFWTLVVGVGILLPLSLEIYELIPHYIWHGELRKHNPWISGVITTSVLIGGFTMRYIIIYAGQMAQIINS